MCTTFNLYFHSYSGELHLVRVCLFVTYYINNNNNNNNGNSINTDDDYGGGGGEGEGKGKGNKNGGAIEDWLSSISDGR